MVDKMEGKFYISYFTNALTFLIRKRITSIELGGLGQPSAYEVCSMRFAKKEPVHIGSHQKFLVN
ncbi:hypothetical protein Ahy_A01g003074 isoform B [Arachis hypogaea]|uniref:Uncharacterized protein n=1 Tax=Arachis hypogaea TaxID=3818 RepID=A0A445ESI5_ARAHY|nr:hypothetical protein Ahy_A01g003074 isoform B [Arachis hypogaea]